VVIIGFDVRKSKEAGLLVPILLLSYAPRDYADSVDFSDSSWTVFLVAVEYFQEESICMLNFKSPLKCVKSEGEEHVEKKWGSLRVLIVSAEPSCTTERAFGNCEEH